MPITLALMLAYVLGTTLFPSDPHGRSDLALGLSAVALAALAEFQEQEGRQSAEDMRWFPDFLLLFIWVILDTSLFEILSRSASISIWRAGHTASIVGFHCAGLLAAYWTRERSFSHHGLIFGLFLTSYAAAFGRADTILAVVYPFVISYYNFRVLYAFVGVRSLKQLGVAMAFTGTIASGIGLGVAVERLYVLPALLLVGSLPLLVWTERLCLRLKALTLSRSTEYYAATERTGGRS